MTILGLMGPWRLSPGTKGPSGYRRGPGGQASWAAGGYRRGPRALAAIAGDLGAGPHGAWRLSPQGPGAPASIPGVDKALINPKIIHQPHLSAGLPRGADPSPSVTGLSKVLRIRPKRFIFFYEIQFFWFSVFFFF